MPAWNDPPGSGPFTIGLLVHPSQPVDSSVELVRAWAGTHAGEVVVRRSDAGRVGPRIGVLEDDAFLARVDGVVSLGGDGTMLGAMRLLAARPVPILGVNHGNLGFLVEVSPDELPAALGRLQAGDFVVEPHSCVDVDRPRQPTTAAFNDVVLAADQPSAGVSLDLEVNGSRYGYYRCDALVISTPNGSTAYNYAAGGPIVSPSTPALVMTPVAPMSGISRSVVLGAGDVIALRSPGPGARVVLDGTAAGSLDPGSTLTTRLRSDAAQVVRLDTAAHAQRSRVKLSLLDLPLRQDQLLELIPPELRAARRRR